MSAEVKRIAVIGGGASGLLAIKCCLDEKLIPVCFERTDAIGGLWNFTETPVMGNACVLKSTITNTSKEIMAFSDFPVPEEFPFYMHNKQYLAYLNLYAEAFKLNNHIRVNTEVLKVEKTRNFIDTGRWEIHSRHQGTHEVKIEEFDGVLVCSGSKSQKIEPDFPGLTSFRGKVIHSNDFRNVEVARDKNVLIIGMGNSSSDVAVELSRIASKVFVSTRRGVFILGRLAPNGYPIDMFGLKRTNELLKHVVGLKYFANKYLLSLINRRFDHDLYCLSPKGPPLNEGILINDDIQNQIACGTVKIKTDVKRFTETGVEFIDGTTADDIDLVITATGYDIAYPFIHKDVFEVKDGHIQLYKLMYPPDLEHPTLAVIGKYNVGGPVMPLSELQCRIATQVFKGQVTLPDHSEQWRDIRRMEANSKRQFPNSHQPSTVSYIPFADDLAKLAGCMPDYWHILKSDPLLGVKMIFGPITPYHYRVMGHGKWDGARHAILTQWDRVAAPLRTRTVPQKDGSDMIKWNILAVAVLVFVVLGFLIF